MNKYQRDIKGVAVDVYDVLKAFGVTCPATQHAIKKLLAPGQRGVKDTPTDLKEARQSIDRAIELAGGNEPFVRKWVVHYDNRSPNEFVVPPWAIAESYAKSMSSIHKIEENGEIVWNRNWQQPPTWGTSSDTGE